MENKEYTNGSDDWKKEILSELFISEKEYIMEKLQEVVSKSKNLFKIDKDTGGILFDYDYVGTEKIQLFLIGKYFSKEFGIIETAGATLGEISEGIDVKNTSLSKPISQLISQNFVKKEDRTYFIRPHQIENVINKIYDRYVEEEKEGEPQTEITGISGKKSVNKKNLEKKEKSGEKRKLQKQKEQLVVQPLSIGGSKKLKPQKQPEGIEKLANDLSVDVEFLDDIFEFDGGLRVIKHIGGRNEKEKQIKNTLVLLTAHKYYCDMPEITSSELRKQLKELGVGALVNLSTNINEYNIKKRHNLILHEKPKRGGKKTTYRISTPGIKEGLKLIKEICSGE